MNADWNEKVVDKAFHRLLSKGAGGVRLGNVHVSVKGGVIQAYTLCKGNDSLTYPTKKQLQALRESAKRAGVDLGPEPAQDVLDVDGVQWGRYTWLLDSVKLNEEAKKIESGVGTVVMSWDEARELAAARKPDVDKARRAAAKQERFEWAKMASY